MLIRQAVLKDLEDITNIYISQFKDTMSGTDKIYKARLEDKKFLATAIINSNFESFVAEEDGHVLGFIIIKEETTLAEGEFTGESYGNIIDISVDPNYRSLGLDKRLLEVAIKWSGNKDFEFVTINIAEEKLKSLEIKDGLEDGKNSGHIKILAG